MTVCFIHRFVVYGMVLNDRCRMIPTVVVDFVVVAVAGTQGYETDDGEADFDELVHFLGSFYC